MLYQLLELALIKTRSDLFMISYLLWGLVLFELISWYIGKNSFEAEIWWMHTRVLMNDATDSCCSWTGIWAIYGN